MTELRSTKEAYRLIVLVSNDLTTVDDLLEFYVNTPPIPGVFKFINKEGYGLSTEFKVNISGWTDSPEDM